VSHSKSALRVAASARGFDERRRLHKITDAIRL
jgi:hypothetical protein